jgi:hypothetical protein
MVRELLLTDDVGDRSGNEGSKRQGKTGPYTKHTRSPMTSGVLSGDRERGLGGSLASDDDHGYPDLQVQVPGADELRSC